MNPKVNWFFEKNTKWQESFAELREIVLETGLTEELSWGCPCYTHNNDKIVLIHGFKDYCALLFLKGALLTDEHKILVQQTENVQAARQLRFKSLEDILAFKPLIIDYLKEATFKSQSGEKVKLKKTEAYSIPSEFQMAMDDSIAFKEAFNALTPGRQRGYLLYFSSAKQSKTRLDRIEKYYQKILDGKGLDD